MKIKNKMIISILLIITAPFFLSVIFVQSLYKERVDESFQTINTPGGAITNHLIVSNLLVEELGTNEARSFSEEEIIELSEEFDEVTLGRGYGYFITKDNEIIMRSDDLIGYPPFETYQNKQFPKNNSREEEELIGIGVASFLFQDGSLGRVNVFLNSEQYYKDYQVYYGTFFIAFILLLITLSLVLLLWISRSVNHPLKKLEAVTTALIEGDYEKSITESPKSDFYKIVSSMDVLRLSLKKSIEKTQELELEKQKIISNISHDIRTPLTSISGFAHGLRIGIAKDEKTRNEYLEIIEKKVKHVETLIEDLKLLEDYDQQKSNYDFLHLDLRDFIIDCVEEMSKDIEKVGGNIRFNVPDEKLTIFADSGKMNRVLSNIIRNSIKYRNDIPLDIEVGVEAHSKKCVISIRDNGQGIPEEDIPFIFDRFYRVDKSRNQNIAGSGLGLSICKDIIIAHGGSIEAVHKEIGVKIEIVIPRV